MADMDFDSDDERQGGDLASKVAYFLVLLKGVWYRKRYIMASMWITCALGWVAVAAMPNQYETTTQFVADTRSILKPLLEGIAVQDDPEEEIQIVSCTLLSRPNLEDIAQKTDLHLAATDENAYEGLIKNLKTAIEIKGTRGTNLYSISYRHPDPDTAKAVVELTLKKFIDTISSQSRTDTVSAKSFLDKQIEQYKERLASSESKLAQFKREHLEHLPGRDSDYYGELDSVKDELESISIQLQEYDAKISGLRGRFIPSGTESGESPEGVVSTPYDNARSDLESRLEQLRITYTDKHPNIQELLKRLAYIKEQQAESRNEILLSASRGQITGDNNGQPTAIQEFALEISKLESEKDALKARESALLNKLNTLRENLDYIPEIEKQLASLTRDYDNDKSYYNELLKRRDSAEITGSADTDTRSVKFQVMEPPMRAIKPVGPPRLLLYIAVLFFGASIGVGVAFMVSQVNPVVINNAHLERIVGKQNIIGQIVDVEHNKHRRKLWIKALIFGLSTLLLVFMLSGLVAHEVMFNQSPMMWLK